MRRARVVIASIKCEREFTFAFDSCQAEDVKVEEPKRSDESKPAPKPPMEPPPAQPKQPEPGPILLKGQRVRTVPFLENDAIKIDGDLS